MCRSMVLIVGQAYLLPPLILLTIVPPPALRKTHAKGQRVW